MLSEENITGLFVSDSVMLSRTVSGSAAAEELTARLQDGWGSNLWRPGVRTVPASLSAGRRPDLEPAADWNTKGQMYQSCQWDHIFSCRFHRFMNWKASKCGCVLNPLTFLHSDSEEIITGRLCSSITCYHLKRLTSCLLRAVNRFVSSVWTGFPLWCRVASLLWATGQLQFKSGLRDVITSCLLFLGSNQECVSVLTCVASIKCWWFGLSLL